MDLGDEYRITQIKTKGGGWDGYDEWVTKYRLKISTNGVNWSIHGDFIGNSDGNTVVAHTLSNGGFVARYLRFKTLISHTWPTMRIEAYGYLGM